MNIGIIGLGLIGGSVAIAAKRNGHLIHGYDESPQTCQYALQNNIVDHSHQSIKELADDAQLLVIAVPMGAYEDVLLQLAPYLQKDSLITDCGSVKSSVIELSKKTLDSEAQKRFVPAHPIAGKESSGFKFACGDLFKERSVIFCTNDQTDSNALQTIQNFWESMGASVVKMTAQEHDEIFSDVSHLPHILAFAIVNLINDSTKRDSLIEFSAGGFRDFTRIAGSHPTMWKDICLSNKTNILKSINNYQSVLNDITLEIENDDNHALYQRFSSSKKLREQWINIIDR